MKQWETVMQQALELAAQAEAAGDVPVGALILDANLEVIATGKNQREIPPFDPTAHAEIVAMRKAAAKLSSWRLSGCTLVVTLEPCAMCAASAVAARIDRVVFGAWDPKAGACGSLRDLLRDTRVNHRPEVYGGVLAPQAERQLAGFFANRRD